MGKRPSPLADSQPSKRLRAELADHDYHQGKVWSTRTLHKIDNLMFLRLNF